jgi:hypothetical protein
MSFDAYLKFTENDFIGGARLDPAGDGRPDSRPDVRESAPLLGNLASDFDFHQAPRPPFILNPCPPITLRPRPKPGCRNSVPLHFGTWGTADVPPGAGVDLGPRNADSPARKDLKASRRVTLKEHLYPSGPQRRVSAARGAMGNRKEDLRRPSTTRDSYRQGRRACRDRGRGRS